MRKSIKQDFPYLTVTDIRVIEKESKYYDEETLMDKAEMMDRFRFNVGSKIYFTDFGNISVFSMTNSPEHQWMISQLIFHLLPHYRVYPEGGLKNFKVDDAPKVDDVSKDYEPDLMIFDKDNRLIHMFEIEHNKSNRIIGGTKKKSEECLKSIGSLKYVYIIRIMDNAVHFHKLSKGNTSTRIKKEKLDRRSSLDRLIMQAVDEYKRTNVKF